MSKTTNTLSENQPLFSVILDHVPALIYLRDRDGRFQMINAHYERTYGVKREDVVGRRLHDVLPKKYADLYAARDAEIIKSGETIEHETRLPGDNGERVFAAVKFPIHDDAGNIASVGGIAFEVTEHRSAEAELHETQGRLTSMMQASPIGASIVNVGGTHEFMNDRLLSMLGLTSEEFMRSNARNFYVDPTERDRVYERLGKEGRIRDMELHMKRADGTPFWALVSFEPTGMEGKSQYFAWLYDITARKQAEHNLRERSNFFRLLGRTAEHANTATTFEDAIRNFLTDICMFTGWPVGHAYVRATEGPDRLQPTGIWHLSDADRFAKFREVTERTEFTPGVGLPGRVMASGKPEWIKDVTEDKNFPRAKQATDIGVRAGFAIPVIVESEVAAVLEFFATTPIEPDESQLMTFMQAGAQLGRVAERNRAEKALRKSQEALEQNRELLNTILDNIPAHIFLRDLEGNYQFINRTYSDVFGISRDAAVGKGIDEILPEEFVEEHRKVDKEVAQKRRVIEHDVVLKHNGDERIYSAIKFPVIDAEGNVESVGGFSLDITDHRRAEEARHESEEQLRLALENMPGGMRLVDRDLKNVLFNSKYSELCDYPDDLLVVGGSMFDELRFQAERGDFGPGNPDKLIEQVASQYRRGESISSERAIPGGRTLQVDIGPTPEGGFVSILTDITDRLKAEEALRENKLFLEIVLDHMPAHVSVRDIDGKYLILNEKYEKLFDVKREDAIGKTPEEVLPAKYTKLAIERDKEVLKKGRFVERERTMSSDDGERTFLSTAFPIYDSKNSIIAIGGANFEITARRRAEETVRKNEQLLTSILESSPVGAIIVNEDGSHEFVNSCMADMLGVTKEEFLGSRQNSFYQNPTDREQAYEQLLEKGFIRDFEVLMKKADGSPIWALLSAEPTNKGDQPQFFAWFYDISERKRMELELQESRDTFQALADNLPEFITMKSTERRYIFVNRSFEEWTGFGREHVVGKMLEDIYTPEQARELNVLDESVLKSGKSFTRETEFDYPDGNARTVMAIRFPIRSSTGAMLGLGHINHDITKRKQDEERLRKAKDQAEQALTDLERAQKELIENEKMASLGQLTAGIAHEIKNPLNFVNNFAETSLELIEELEEEVTAIKDRLGGEARKNVDDLFGTLSGDLRKINEHGRRADGIVKSMLLHARGGDAIRAKTSINPLVSEALHLAYHGERARDQSFQVTLDEQFQETVGSAEIVPSEITRVLVNLFGNAFYAVKKRTKQTTEKDYEPTVSVVTADRGTGTEIRVRDNGTGIPPEARDKLFEPFFTTKPPGEGTGLGLSMCYDIIVRLHGGEMSFDSVVDEFTEFKILLPHHGVQGS